MMAWISPFSTVRSTPLRISRPSTSTWRSSICSSGSLIGSPRSLFARPDENEVPVALHLVGRHRSRRGKNANLSGGDVEAGPVQRALDLELFGFEFSFGQRRLLVGTDVADRVDVLAH